MNYCKDKGAGMARTSKRIKPDKKVNESIFFRAAIYARVSVEEKVSWGTVESQELMGKEYIQKHPDIEFVKCYKDNGVSSFLLVRPAFDQRIVDIELGRINCVIVKDISRFGRDYLATLEYIAETFPAKGVRFISLLEEYDSITEHYEEIYKLPLTSIVNYYYSADISQKVKTSIQIMQQRGTYIFPTLPFGYQKVKQPQGTRIMIKDDEAETVRTIFRMCVEGISSYQIVKHLNKEKPNNIIWTQRMVSRILNNPFYTGTYLTGKTKKLFRENTVIHIPEENWICIEHHHPQIISDALFEMVQGQLKDKSIYKTSAQENDEHVLSGKVYCQYCGRKMKRIKKTDRRTDKIYYSYVCPTYSETGGTACRNNSISERKLKQEVTSQLKQKISEAAELQRNRLQFESSPAFKLWIKERDRQLSVLRERLKRLSETEAMLELYGDANDGIGHIRADFIGVNQYRNSKQRYIEKQILQVKEEIEDYWQYESSKSTLLQLLLENEQNEKLVDKAITKINISDKADVATDFLNDLKINTY